jgi:adenylate kinase family enzyme
MKISLVGNVATGKTRLAKQLSKQHNIVVTHVDSIQFDQYLQIRNMPLVREELERVQKSDQWIIDGNGPLDMLERRFELSDQIFLVDPPLWANIFWLTYRQIKNIIFPRAELPHGSSELNWKHIKKSYRTLWTAYKKMRPELRRMLDRKEFKNKVIIVSKVF